MIRLDVQAFLIDRVACNLSSNTLQYYTQELNIFSHYLEAHHIAIDTISPADVRLSIAELQQRRSPGGVHAYYRAVRAFLNWYAEETPGWLNPMLHVKPPKVARPSLPGIAHDTVKKLILSCDSTFYGLRDKAIISFLYDTGVRVSELCALNIEDVRLETGDVIIRHGKGDKFRIAFVGIKSRRYLVKYVRLLPQNAPGCPLFVARGKSLRISRRSIATMLSRRLDAIGEPHKTPHDFRRGFTKKALESLDVVTVARLLGHSDASLVWRYYHQNVDDLRLAHARASPGDKL